MKRHGFAYRMNSWASFYAIELILIGSSALYSSKKLLIFSIVLAMMFSGLRYEVGNDYWTYLDACKKIPGSLEFEPGFQGLLDLIEAFGLPCDALFLVTSVLTIMFVWMGINKFKRPELAFMFYLVIPGLFINFQSIIRQGLAVSILFYSYIRLVRDEDSFYFLLLGTIAALFHLIALPAMVIMYLIYRSDIKLNKSQCIIALLLCSLSSLFGIDHTILSHFDGGRYEKYFEWQQDPPVAKILVINLLSLCIIFAYFKAKLFDNAQIRKLFNAWLFGLLVFNAFMNFEVFTRVTYFFSIFGIVLIATISDSLPSNRARIFLVFLFSVYLFALLNTFIIDQGRINDGSELTPGFSNYKSILAQ